MKFLCIFGIITIVISVFVANSNADNMNNQELIFNYNDISIGSYIF